MQPYLKIKGLYRLAAKPDVGYPQQAHISPIRVLISQTNQVSDGLHAPLVQFNWVTNLKRGHVSCLGILSKSSLSNHHSQTHWSRLGFFWYFDTPWRFRFYVVIKFKWGYYLRWWWPPGDRVHLVRLGAIAFEHLHPWMDHSSFIPVSLKKFHMLQDSR